MKISLTSLAAIAFVAGFSPITIHALSQSVPSLINYQGKLTDSTGNALPSGTYGLAVRVWDKKMPSSPDETLIWGQEYKVTVANGNFSILLGAGTPVTNATSVNDLAFAFGAPNRFIGLTVVSGTNGNPIADAKEIAPRQQVLSVPYSFQAYASVTANSLSAANGGPTNVVVVAQTGNIGIGTTTPKAPLEVNGAIKGTTFLGDGSQLTGLAPRPLNSSLGTDFREGTSYRNTSGHKLLVVWTGRSCLQGGWGSINQSGEIGPTQPERGVAQIRFAIPGSGDALQSASFIVPDGWYWRISNSTWANCAGTVDLIEAWPID